MRIFDRAALRERRLRLWPVALLLTLALATQGCSSVRQVAVEFRRRLDRSRRCGQRQRRRTAAASRRQRRDQLPASRRCARTRDRDQVLRRRSDREPSARRDAYRVGGAIRRRRSDLGVQGRRRHIRFDHRRRCGQVFAQEYRVRESARALHPGAPRGRTARAARSRRLLRLSDRASVGLDQLPGGQGARRRVASGLQRSTAGGQQLPAVLQRHSGFPRAGDSARYDSRCRNRESRRPTKLPTNPALLQMHRVAPPAIPTLAARRSAFIALFRPSSA